MIRNKSKSPLKQLDRFCTKFHKFLDQEWDVYQDKEYYSIYGDLQSELWETHTQLFFYFVTGEADFNPLYDRLQKKVNDRPIGWGENGFIPDEIANTIYTHDHMGFKERWARVEKLYKEAIKLEQNYLKSRSRKKSKSVEQDE